jgi:hypothetical protein
LNDIETTWLLLNVELMRLEKLPRLTEHDCLEMKNYLGRLRLVQPFDWMHWEAPALSEVDLEQIDLYDCIRHITRLVRGDRFAENSLSSWIVSGHFRALCEAAARIANGQPTPALSKAA